MLDIYMLHKINNNKNDNFAPKRKRCKCSQLQCSFTVKSNGKHLSAIMKGKERNFI